MGGSWGPPLITVAPCWFEFLFVCFVLEVQRNIFFFHKKAREVKSHTFLPSAAQTLPTSSPLSSHSVSGSRPDSRTAVHKVNACRSCGT